MALANEWTEPVEVSTSDPLSSTVFNEQVLQNLLYLQNKPYDEIVYTDGSDVAITSTTPVVLDSQRYQVEIDTLSGLVQVQFALNYSITGNNYAYFGVRVDDDYMFGDVPAGGTTKILSSYYSRDSTTGNVWTGVINISGLSAGIHQFEPMGWVNSGTLTILQTSGYTNQFSAREL